MTTRQQLFPGATLGILAILVVLSTSTHSFADHGKAVVANRASGTISVIDASSAEWIQDLALPPGENPPEPMYVVNTWFRNRVWVGDRANNRVVVFSGRNFELVDTLPTGEGVFHMWADFFGRRLWVVNDIDKTATVINANRLAVVATVPMPEDLVAMGAKPHDVTLDPFGFFSYVTLTGGDPDSDVIVKFNSWSFQEVNRTTVGKSSHVSFNRRYWEIYAPSQTGNAISVLDNFTMEVTDTIDVPGAHGAITSRNARRFYTTNLPGGGADGVYCINTRSNRIIGTVDTAFNTPHNVALTPSGRKLYVTHSGANDKVSVFQVERNGSLTSLGEVTVGNNPFGLASISTVVQMTPFRFEPPARILDRRDLRLLCFHLR